VLRYRDSEGIRRKLINRCLSLLFIKPSIIEKQKILIVAHGNSLRALVKHLNNLSNEEILKINIPTGIPLVYHLDENLKVEKKYYLGDQNKINKAINLVQNQGNVNSN